MWLERLIGREIIEYDTIDSTNLAAAALAKQGAEEGLVVVADSQTAGRGRRGRNWHSPPGSGLWFSIILKPKLDPRKAGCLALIGALSVARVIRGFGVPARIKWPNDVVGEYGKIAGILAESSFTGDRMNYAVLGIGVNVNIDKSQFPGEMAGVASSVSVELGGKVSRDALFRSILDDIDHLYTDYRKCGFESMKPELIALSATVGQMVRLISGNGEILEGEAKDIGSDGSLILLTGDGELRSVLTGDVEKLRLRDDPPPAGR